MSKSNGRAHAALIGLALAGALLFAFGIYTLAQYQRQHAQEGETAAQYGAQDTRGEVSATCVQEPRTRTYRCTAEVPAANDHDPYAEHDLRAQQDMARWAYVVALVSFATLLMTGAGVWLLWLTLEATREAVTTAEKATAETTRIGEAQVRAYLAIRGALIGLRTAGGEAELKGVITNTGLSPAKQVTIDARLQLFTRPQIDLIEHDVLTLKGALDYIAAGGQESFDIDFDLSKVWSPELRTATLTLMVGYEDVFGNIVPPTTFVFWYSVRDALHFAHERRPPA